MAKTPVSSLGGTQSSVIIEDCQELCGLGQTRGLLLSGSEPAIVNGEVTIRVGYLPRRQVIICLVKHTCERLSIGPVRT
jgi:hypothetical protein